MAGRPRASAASLAAGISLGFESLEKRAMLSVSPRVIDVDQTLYSPSSIGDFTEVGDIVFFTSSDFPEENDNRTGGYELWRTDGTEAGTYRVKDIEPGNIGSDPLELTNFNGTLLFTAESSGYGRRLWRSDGTDAGTFPVHDLQTQSGSSFYNPVPIGIVVVGDSAYFVDRNSSHETSLWKTDGTVGGTFRVEGGDDAQSLTNFNGALYYSSSVAGATHASGRGELWKTDGTPAGTIRVKDFGAGHPYAASASVAVGGTLYFISTGLNGRELWKTDGTETGTELVKGFNLGGRDQSSVNLTVAGDTIYFTANDPDYGVELWMSDGTSQGTVLTKDIRPGPDWSLASRLTNVDGKLFFVASDGTGGTPLWMVDGGAVSRVEGVPVASSNAWTGYLTAHAGRVYFTVNDGTSGEELWSTDGTPTGTMRVRDIKPGSGSSSPANMRSIGSKLFFSARSTSGQQLWTSDGTTDGTVFVKAFNVATASSNPRQLTQVGDELFFFTSAPAGPNRNYQLWRTDGSQAETKLVASFENLPTHQSIEATNVNGTLFFSLNTTELGFELWKSDGTPEGTGLVLDVAPGPVSGQPLGLVNFNGALYFLATNAASGTQLWRSDGTTAGTGPITSLPSSVASWVSTNICVVDGVLYFAANTLNGYELWKSDGTPTGTVAVKDIRSGQLTAGIRSMVALDGVLYFLANDGVNGEEMWRSDGTAAGTHMVKDIFPGNSSWVIGDLSKAGDAIYFNADDGIHGSELWRSDGTAAGTNMVRDLIPGNIGPMPTSFVAVGDAVYFAARRSFASSMSLWRSDGTSEGTVPFDLDARSHVDPLGEFNGEVYFIMDSENTGTELWRIDAASGQAVQVADLNVGRGHSTPQQLINVNGKLFFTANDVTHGRELWVIDPAVLAGDFNGDHRVDGGDFLAWQRQFGAAGSGNSADDNGDGDIDGDDLQVWREHYGASGGLATTASRQSEPAAPYRAASSNETSATETFHLPAPSEEAAQSPAVSQATAASKFQLPHTVTGMSAGNEASDWSASGDLPTTRRALEGRAATDAANASSVYGRQDAAGATPLRRFTALAAIVDDPARVAQRDAAVTDSAFEQESWRHFV